MSSLFERLKSGTEREHRELEALIDPMKNFCSLEAYKAHLLKTWKFYRSLEAELEGVDWPAVGIDFNHRRKTPLLDLDLLILAVPFIRAEHRKETLRQADPDFAIGCLYVVEGATLGGQVISRHLAKLGIGPENGGLFFNGYGAKTGEMWKSFRAGATNYCVTDDQIGHAVEGAKSTFDKFRESMLTREDPTPHVA
jgi:heme oxygenase